MDKVRQKTGLTDKLSITRLTSLMDHFDLHVNPNLLSKTEWTISINHEFPMWSGLDLWDLQPSTTYTFTWQARTSGNNQKVRLRLFDAGHNSDKTSVWGGKEFPLTSGRQSYTFTTPDTGEYGLWLYGSAAGINQNADVIIYNAKLEHGDLATPLTNVGGN